MGTSFKVHAGLALALSVSELLLAAFTYLPGEPVLNTGVGAGIGIGLLFPLFIAAIVRGIVLDFSGGGILSNKSLQWLALRCLPRTVQTVLVCILVAGVALLAGIGAEEGSRQAGPVRGGRHYAFDTTLAHRGEVEVAKSEYDSLVKNDQRRMFAIIGLLAGGAATLTLVTGALHAATDRSRPVADPDVQV
jgi:hypothetical protein